MNRQPSAVVSRIRPVAIPVAEFARKRAKIIIVVASAVVLLLTVWRAAVAAPRAAYLTPGGGIWLTLGDDLRHGEFYRPIVNPEGYGGTRYFPLEIALLGGLMKLGVPPITAGFAITFASAVALAGGVAAFLRRMGAPRWFALSVGVLCFAPRPVQDLVMSIHCDLLPVALSFWGLAVCASLQQEDRPSRIWVASALFALAFAAKATSVFGAGGSVIWLLVNGRRRRALQLAFLTAATAGVLIGATELASGGRFLNVLFTCGLAGGGWRRALQGPYQVLYQLSDPTRMSFAILAGIVLWLSGRVCLRELPALTIAVTVLGTAMILTTPGTSLNHMVDLFVILVVVAASAVALRHVSVAFGGVLLAVICVASAVDRTANQYSADRVDRVAIYRRVVEATGQGRAPLLADDAMVPLTAGERPVVLDSFMLSVILRKRPEIAADFQARVSRRAFRALVVRPVGVRHGQVPSVTVDFASASVPAEVLDRAYYKADQIDGYLVYLPRESAADTGSLPTGVPRH